MSDTALSPKAAPLEVERVRADFPCLDQAVHGRPLCYLDNAATTQKPRAVIEAVARYYERDNANVHRGIHALAERATEAYEQARGRVARFLNARDPAEIVFVRGTTEAINLVASSLGFGLREGDEVLITEMEHHSNIVPWQLLRDRKGVRLKVLPMDDRGVLRLDRLDDLLTERTRLVAVVHCSNALGTVNPVAEIAARAHAAGALVLVDGAQAVPHLPVDVQALGADFYAFSGHKVYGPMGIGCLYGRRELLAELPPYQGGGEMIRRVTFEETTYAEPPARFEAGTPNVAGAVGLAAALDYLEGLGLERVAAYEEELLAYALERVAELPGVRLIGTAPERLGILSMAIDGAHPHDIATILDRDGIAIRAGHHCAHPVMDHFGVPATARASLALYNTRDEIDRLIEGVHHVKEVLGR
ncbi:MAG: cysteine desulfurase [Nitrospirae bacterium]|nr:MAG: cysteine desulfurase [Nitrospirota bacterium]